MFFSKRVFFSSIGLAIVVSTSAWLVIKSAQEQISKGDLPADFIESTARDVSYQKFNASGEMVYQGHSLTAKRYHNGDALLGDVNIIFYNKDKTQSPWYIDSKYAKVTQSNDKIHMYDHVVMQRKRTGKNSPAIKIQTKQVIYLDSKDDLTTKDKVTITEPETNNITTGFGLKAKSKAGEFKLLKNVRSYYEGNPK